MDPDRFYPRKRYYCVLGLSSNASPSAIRKAYKKLAMRWHPDKCAGQEGAEAKLKFQEIQEAYAVLSDQNKKLLYDSGLYNPEDDDHHHVEGFTSFLNEMSGMMTDVKAEEAGKGSTFEELQQLFVSMFSTDLSALNNQCQTPASSIDFDKKGWGGGHYDANSLLGTYMMDHNAPFPQHLFSDTFQCSSSMGTSAAKTKDVLHGSHTTGGSYDRPYDYESIKKS